MSPARRWPPPHRPQGCSFCPWFFPGPQAFPATNSPKSVPPAGSSGGGGTGPQPGVSLWWGRGCGSSSQGSARSPFPGIPRGSRLELPCAPPLPMATLSGGSAPLCPGSVGRGMVHLGVISATPYPSAVPSWPGGRDGVGMGPQSSARPSSRSAPWISLLEKWVLPLLGLGRAPAPCRAVLQRPCPCCSQLLIPFLCKDLVRACPRLSDPRAVTLAPGGPRAAPPAPSRAGSPRDRSHVPGAPAPAQVD